MVEDEPNDVSAPRAGASPRANPRAKPQTNPQTNIDPLLDALQDDPDGEAVTPSGSGRSRLGWKLFWAAVVLLALIAVVMNQAF
jgi:hypothetical protein